MEIIYAPWRMDYLVRDKSKDECVFCEDNTCFEDKYVLFKGKYSYIKLNTFPYNCGHLLVIPATHAKELNGLSWEAGAEVMKLLSISCDILKKVYRCDAINVGLNLGKAAGAGIEQHLHFHIIPRWEGDVSFYTVCSELRVVSEILDDTYNKLIGEFQKIKL
jgi:Diadenosine tetraphosphate (Ap4A) hydrolase and other HIT family hydrolases